MVVSYYLATLLQGSRLLYLNLFDSQVWTKHSGRPAYRTEAKLFLPGKTLEEIEQHEDWHQELIYLQDRKREVGSLQQNTCELDRKEKYFVRYMMNKC